MNIGAALVRHRAIVIAMMIVVVTIGKFYLFVLKIIFILLISTLVVDPVLHLVTVEMIVTAVMIAEIMVVEMTVVEAVAPAVTKRLPFVY
jgi:hypothetical protein